MATIPMSGSGQRGPAPVQHTHISGEGADAAARAAQGLGNTVAAEATGFLEQQQRERSALIRLRASNSVIDYQTKIDTITNDLDQKMVSGTLQHERAAETYQSAVQQIESSAVDGMDRVTTENYQFALQQARQKGLSQIEKGSQVARNIEMRGQVDLMVDSLGKQAGQPGADVAGVNAKIDALDEQGRLVYGAAWTEKKQSFRDANWFNHANEQAMLTRDNMDGLKKLEKELTKKDGFYVGKLDTEKRNVVLKSVINNRIRLENRIQIDADRREVKAAQVINDFDRQNASGVAAPAETLSGWQDIVKGTTQEGAYRQRLDDAEEIQSVLRLPIDQQLIFVQQRDAKMQSGGATLREQANATRLKSAVQDNVKLLQNEPLLFTQARTGTVVEPLDMSSMLDPAAGEQLATQMRDRTTTINAMQKQYGNQVKMNPLLPQEASMLTGLLNQATPDQAGALFSTLYKAFADDSAYMGAMQQIAPDSIVRATAGALYAKQRKAVLQKKYFSSDIITTSGDVSRIMLMGESLLNKTKEQRASDGASKSFPSPPEIEFRTAFSTAVGKVYADNPVEYDAAMQAVRAYYTGRAAQEGDVSGVINSSRMKQAVSAVVGKVVDYNGSNVIAPWGMDESTFNDRVYTAIQRERSHNNNSFPKGITLRHGREEGKYLATTGRSLYLDKSGKPIVIDVMQGGDRP